jgi:uncharacterized protein (DUF1501 family)
MGALSVESNVTTFTESDFSRTFQPNGNAGSDHGWGSHALVMGGAVNGGNLLSRCRLCTHSDRFAPAFTAGHLDSGHKTL